MIRRRRYQVRVTSHTALILIACGVCLTSTAADAQGRRAEPGRIEVAGGGGWFGGGALGPSDANLRANSTGSSPYRLFTTDTQFGAAPVLEARVSVALSRRFAVEGRLGYSRPELRTTISSDAEQGNAVTALERMDQYMVDGSIVVMLGSGFGSLAPFVAAGGGYLRQVHEGQTLIVDGHSYHVGGGIKRRLFTHERRFVKSAGVRGDVRVYLLSGGEAFDTDTHSRFAASGSFFIGF
jgi:hypothetical protein